ncbi:TerC family protein [Pantoea trifolii]|uniref:TerC family protein n=1 Tax=Pantoea trifolii TaxID=2968030 RepID=A0ABT1VLC5_9GAMM|nr:MULTISPECIES: TerC family protein [unclassified Pantoea]MCQ8228321.1 TerC family protein [Pantoea sp. MMK2]MCQ8236494.1 TerC family protein [Pantoea sp. MMK3]
MLEWIIDPSLWAGLVTLIVLELVLGIDNLVFIAILVEKLPSKERDRARVIGLLLALVSRLALLASLSWLVTLTKPLFTLLDHGFSARDLLLLCGGFFLLYKATTELNSRLEGADEETGQNKNGAKFWPVVAQIVVLDAIFSLDSVITAVGMVNELPVMMAAVTVAILLMLLASKPLTRFVNGHPTIVILCLSFLLMIGFSLVAEGLGFIIPKGYLYAAIGFSIVIEILNQLAMFNRRRYLTAGRPLRQRTSEAVLRILRGEAQRAELDADTASLVADGEEGALFNRQERRMIARVLGLGQRQINSIMTSRHDVEHIDLSEDPAEIMAKLDRNQHTRILVTEQGRDPLGVVHVIDLLHQSLHSKSLDLRSLIRQPLIFPERVTLLQALEQFRNARTHFAFVVDEFGSVEGVVTLSDLMETIAGNLPIEGEKVDARYDIQALPDGGWVANGHMPLEDLAVYVQLPLDEKRNYHTLAGLLMDSLQHVPQEGEELQIGDYLLRTLQVENHRVQKVEIMPIAP